MVHEALTLLCTLERFCPGTKEVCKGHLFYGGLLWMQKLKKVRKTWILRIRLSLLGLVRRSFSRTSSMKRRHTGNP